MSWMLTVEGHFCAAHWLPGHGKCGKMHGHNYTVVVALSAECLSDGMVIDFQQAKKMLGTVIDDLDHGTLNEWLVNPTAENLAAHIFREISMVLPEVFKGRLVSVTVEETKGCTATYRRGV